LQAKNLQYILIRYVSISAKFGIFTIVGPNGTIVEAKKYELESLDVCISALTSLPILTKDGFNLDEMDYYVRVD
jgi:hypothetical protein